MVESRQFAIDPARAVSRGHLATDKTERFIDRLNAMRCNSKVSAASYFARRCGKAPRTQDHKWATVPRQATEHNIRSHAHTRAFNRAVSNLVGFGEVSAEEIDRDDERPRPRATRAAGEATISAAQQKRLFAISKKTGG
jgi:hypothetical protein